MDSALHLLDDIDGWPVRLGDDDPMDLLDFDAALPGSFGDFAAWMSGAAAEGAEVVGAAGRGEDVHPGVIAPNPGSSGQPSPQGALHDAQNPSDISLTQPAGHAVHNGLSVPEQQQQQQQIKGEAMRPNSAHSQAQPGGATSSLDQHGSFRSSLDQHSVPDAAALSAAAGKAQQLLMSASSGFHGPAVNTPAAGAFLAPQGSLGGVVTFPPAAFASPPQHHHSQPGVMLASSPAAAGQQAALLLGGTNAAAAAMAAMQQQHSNPFAAAAGLSGYAQAAAMQSMGLGLGVGGHIAIGHQGYALHPNALHTLVGHGVLKHSALERQQKVRKKNTVASLEAELSEKLSQLQLLSAENEMLKLRAGVLEATVQNREDQMRVVWEHGPPTFPIDCPDGVASLTSQQQQQQQEQEQQGEDGSSDADGCGDQQQQQQQEKGLGVAVGSGSSAQLAGMWDDELPAAVVAPQMPTTPSAKAEPASSASAAARTASNCSNLSAAAAAAAGAPVDSPSSSSNRDGAAAAAAPSGSANSGGTNSSTFDQHTARLPLPQQKDSLLSIKRMTDVDVIQHWKNFLQEVTSALVQLQREESAAAAAPPAGGNGNGSGSAAQQQQQEAVSSPRDADGAAAAAAAAAVSPAEQRVRDLVDKYCYLVRTSQTLNPSAYCRLFGRHLDTGETLPYNDSHWRNVVAVLGLSKDQVTHILACAELYFSSRAKLQAEQRALQAQLKAAELSPLDLLGGDADNPLRPWLERLASNLKREHNLRIMLNSYVWGRIFTHVQKAKAAVYSHPLYVDIHALVCVMCEDALAAAGAPRGNSAQQQQQQQSQAQAQAHAQQQAQVQQQQQQFAAAYAACQQQQQQQMAGYMQYMAGHGLV